MTLFTWSFQLRFSSKCIPRSFVHCTRQTAFSLHFIWYVLESESWCFWTSCDVQNKIDLVLSSVNKRFSFVGHCNRLFRSFSRFCAHHLIAPFLQLLYRVVPSAYWAELLDKISDKSAIYKLKSTRPNILPCVLQNTYLTSQMIYRQLARIVYGH